MKWKLYTKENSSKKYVKIWLPDGSVTRKSTGKVRIREAKEAAKKIVAQMEEKINTVISDFKLNQDGGRQVETRIRNTVFLKDLVDYYLDVHCKNENLKSYNLAKYNSNTLFNFFGRNKNVYSLTRKTLHDFVGYRRGKGIKNFTIARELTFLAACLNTTA